MERFQCNLCLFRVEQLHEYIDRMEHMHDSEMGDDEGTEVDTQMQHEPSPSVEAPTDEDKVTHHISVFKCFHYIFKIRKGVIILWLNNKIQGNVQPDEFACKLHMQICSNHYKVKCHFIPV